MKFVSIILLAVLSCNVFAGLIFPTFNGSRVEWKMMEAYGIPIIVDSGTEVGFTNPSLGMTPYSFQIHLENENLICEFDNELSTNNDIFISGNHTGPGTVLGSIKIYGYGEVSISELNPATNKYDYLGSFTVVPETSTICLLAMGIILFFPTRLQSVK